MGRPAARRLAKNPLVVLLLVAALLVQASGRRLSAESEQAQVNSGCKPRQVGSAGRGVEGTWSWPPSSSCHPAAAVTCSSRPISHLPGLLQVHLALTGDPTQLLVSWKTKGKG